MNPLASQVVLDCDGDAWRQLCLPHQSEQVLPGVAWGEFDAFLTPAFWASQAWLHTPRGRLTKYRLGTTLQHEIVACILGGYGIPAEIGLAAFDRLRSEGVLKRGASSEHLATVLAAPLRVGGRVIHYRFARQKASYIADALARLDHVAPPGASGKDLRDRLATLRGVGLKTASWITRNWCDSDDVAILDVHVCRAGEEAGVFTRGSDPARDYRKLEARFLEFAAAIGVRASVLDNLIWQTMRRLPRPMYDRSVVKPLDSRDAATVRYPPCRGAAGVVMARAGRQTIATSSSGRRSTASKQVLRATSR